MGTSPIQIVMGSGAFRSGAHNKYWLERNGLTQYVQNTAEKTAAVSTNPRITATIRARRFCSLTPAGSIAGANNIGTDGSDIVSAEEPASVCGSGTVVGGMTRTPKSN